MEKVSLDISREEKLSGTVRSFLVLCEPHKWFKEKDAMKNAWVGIAKALEFILKLSHSFGLIH